MTALSSPTIARRSPHATRRRLASAALLVVAAAATLAVMLPILIIVFTAFKPVSEVNAYPPTLLPGAWTLDNFTRIFTELPFARLIANSFVFAGGVTLFALVFDSLAAYALARLDFRGSKVLLIAIIASLMIPFQATLIPIYQLVSDLGWVNSYAGLIAPRAADAFGSSSCRCPAISTTPHASTARASSASSAASCCRTRCPHCSPSGSTSS